MTVYVLVFGVVLRFGIRIVVGESVGVVRTITTEGVGDCLGMLDTKALPLTNAIITATIITKICIVEGQYTPLTSPYYYPIEGEMAGIICTTVGEVPDSARR